MNENVIGKPSPGRALSLPIGIYNPSPSGSTRPAPRSRKHCTYDTPFKPSPLNLVSAFSLSPKTLAQNSRPCFHKPMGTEKLTTINRAHPRASSFSPLYRSTIWRSLLLIWSVALVGCDQPMGKKPTGTLDRYAAAQPVASQRDMARLIALLRKGDVATFNQLRTNPPYAGKRLDFRGSSLARLRLEGADLSNSILANVNLTGADLNHACLRGSYLATAYVGLNLRSAPLTNPTCLANCDFTGAILVATEYITTSEFKEPIDVWTKIGISLDLCKSDISGAIGLVKAQRRVAGPYRLEELENSRCYLQKAGAPQTGDGCIAGMVEQVGWTNGFIFAKRISTYRTDPDGWMIINVTNQSISGPLRETEFRQSYPGVETLSPHDAWKKL